MYERELKITDSLKSEKSEINGQKNKINTKIIKVLPISSSKSNKCPIRRKSKTKIIDDEYFLIIPRLLPTWILFLPFFLALISATELVIEEIYGFGYKIIGVLALFCTLVLTYAIPNMSIGYSCHEVLRINRYRISYISRVMYYMYDKINVSGLGFTLENAYFDLTSLETLSSTEHVVMKNNEGHNLVRRHAVIEIKEKDGPRLRFGHRLSLEEKDWIVEDIRRFAAERNIVIPECY